MEKRQRIGWGPVKLMGAAARYGFALISAVLMLFVLSLLVELLQGVIFTIPVASVAVVALLAGAGPGFLYCTLVGIGTLYFFQEPVHSFVLANEREVVRQVSYYLAGFIVVLVIEVLHRTWLDLAVARARAEHILNIITDAFIELDENWDFVDANLAAEKMLGMSRDKLIGKLYWEVFRGVGSPLERRLIRVVEERSVDHFELFYPPSSLWFEMHACSTDGGGLAIYFRDVTMRKEAENSLRESEESFRAFFNQAAVGVAEVDLCGRFVIVNDRLCQMTGYGREELLAMTIFEITHPDDRKQDCEFYLSLKSGLSPMYQLQKRYLCKDGSAVSVQVHGAMVQDRSGSLLHRIAIFLMPQNDNKENSTRSPSSALPTAAPPMDL